MQAYFEPVSPSESCVYCSGRRTVTPLPQPVDAVYCISLQEQPHRTAASAAHFHDIGLCRHVTFYRPVRGRNGARAIWESHQALARHAVAHRYRSALMLEDDVYFRRSWADLVPAIGRALAALPDDWWALYLGHIPVQAYFVRLRILRVRSGGAHAYIAGPRLLAWLVETRPQSAATSGCRVVGETVDDALANLPGMYALFPMVARQRFLGDYRHAPSIIDAAGRRRPWLARERWRPLVWFRGALLVEKIAVMLSPVHWLTLERQCVRGGNARMRLARLIHESGLFDPAYYLEHRPDVAVHEADPLWHYIHSGAREGAWPSPLFDPDYYAAQGADLRRRNPLAHYIRIGSASGRKPHPLFDTAFYLTRYGAKIPPGLHPLRHFLTIGGAAGFDPHPLFDSAWYLARHRQVAERGENPLLHYLAAGWRQGAAPHPQFDGDLYLRTNPDVKAAGVNPLVHFVRYGQAEGRPQPDASPQLSAATALAPHQHKIPPCSARR